MSEAMRAVRGSTPTHDMARLRLAGALGGLGQAVAGVVGTLAARSVGHSEWIAGLPQTLLVAGSAVAALVLSAVARHRSRTTAIACGGLVATVGCVLGSLACLMQSLVGLCAASVLVGSGVFAVMFSRYAAVDLPGGTGDPARALSVVLTAIAVGAVAGPNLIPLTSRAEHAAALPFGTVAYTIGAAAFLAATVAWHGLARGRGPAGRTTVRLDVGTRSQAMPVAVLGVANLLMVAVMTMAPIQMHDHEHSGLTVIGLVVSAHIAAMFAPSPLTGRFVARVGDRMGVAAGGLLYVSATALATLGAARTETLALAMVVLGLAWNLTTVAASSALTRGSDAAQRLRREGLGEIGMGVAAAIGGLSSGVVMADAGYEVLAALALAITVVVLLPLSPGVASASARTSASAGPR